MALKKLGIFLGNAPEQSLKNQGIGRLLCFLLAAEKSTEITFAVPSWYKTLLIELLNDHNIPSNQYQLISTPREPYLLTLRKYTNPQLIKEKFISFLKKIRQKFPVSLPKSRKISFIPKIKNLIMHGVTSSSIILFTASIIPFFIFSGLFLIFLIAARVLWFCRKIISTLKRKKSITTKQLTKKNIFFNRPLRELKHNQFAQNLYEAMRKQELGRLVELINKKKDIPIWFIPALSWPEVANIKAIKVIAAPDVVFLEFPGQFTQPYWHQAFTKVIQSLECADHIICYSEHVKKKQLIPSFNIKTNNLSLIRHGCTELSSYLVKQGTNNSRTKKAQQILRGYQQKYLSKDPYLENFDFDSMKFIFYSSQSRPHKNFINLFKAYEILLRERYLGIKLIITADLSSDGNELIDFLEKKRLQFDIISFHNVSSEVLAALNHLAVCAVNPTLFEGGFPFTFTEAYSVGTPSIMSNIAVCNEIIRDESLKKIMLFDPYDVNNMVERIAWAIEHRQELFELQKPLFEQLAQRTWSNVAKEYMSLFEKIANDAPVQQ